jgi:hypothetical protein
VLCGDAVWVCVDAWFVWVDVAAAVEDESSEVDVDIDAVADVAQRSAAVAAWVLGAEHDGDADAVVPADRVAVGGAASTVAVGANDAAGAGDVGVSGVTAAV